jgi:hypothetical protein
MTLPEVDELLQSYRKDAAGWLTRAAIEPTPGRIAIAEKAFHAQPATTLKAMTQSVIETTSQPSYFEDVNAVLDSGIPMHLFAGQRCARAGTCLSPYFRRAASMTVQPGVGHIMLEAPEEFLGLVAPLLQP